MREHFAIAVALLCVLALAAPARASVTLTGFAQQTVSGQDFVFEFPSVALSDGTAGTFRIHARGDYSSPGSASGAEEYLTWDIEGLVSATASPYLGSPIIQHYGGNDNEWEAVYTISGAHMDLITADSQISAFVDLSSAVNMGVAAENWVEVSLTYEPVPEPATLSLLALGISALAIRRRRRS